MMEATPPHQRYKANRDELIRGETQTDGRIVFDCPMANDPAMIQQGKTQMKTIQMLIVGLMLAGCGSMENHVRNRTPAPGAQYGSGDAVAVDIICACP